MTATPRILVERVLLIAFLASLLWHLIIIFYTPPVDFEFLSMQTQPSAPPNQLRIKLKGEMQSNLQAETTEQQGEFSEAFGIDKEKWAKLLSKLEKNTGLSNAYKQVYDEINSKFKVKDSYIYRQRNHEDIVVKDVFPTIHNIEKPFSEILKAAPKDLQDHNERNEIIKQYRDWKLGKNDKAVLIVSIDSKEKKKSTTPLVFPEPERKRYFDENLTLPKGLQLNNFIRKYFSYDPDKGDLPIATRELYYKNLQRLAYSFSSDPSYLYLDYFLENLNKEDFLKNSLYQASKLDKTKTQTELLFALEDIYHIQQRAWRYYFEFDKIYKSTPEGKKKYLRVETLKRVIEGYRETLKAKGIDDYKKIEQLYRKKRLEILDYIVKNTPDAYRRADALFEKAAVYWQQGYEEKNPELLQKAVEQWLSIAETNQVPDTIPLTTDNTSSEQNPDHLNQHTLKKLLTSLKNYTSGNPVLQQSATREIQRILSTRHALRIAKKRQREEQLLWR